MGQIATLLLLHSQVGGSSNDRLAVSIQIGLVVAVGVVELGFLLDLCNFGFLFQLFVVVQELLDHSVGQTLPPEVPADLDDLNPGVLLGQKFLNRAISH